MLSDVTFRVQCDFIPGSDVQGCMIVLVGDYNNVSVTLLMNQTNSEIINVTTSVSCYKRVIAFDIEYDGQIGTLAVPGKVSGNVNTTTRCLPRAGTQGIMSTLSSRLSACKLCGFSSTIIHTHRNIVFGTRVAYAFGSFDFCYFDHDTLCSC